MFTFIVTQRVQDFCFGKSLSNNDFICKARYGLKLADVLQDVIDYILLGLCKFWQRLDTINTTLSFKFSFSHLGTISISNYLRDYVYF